MKNKNKIKQELLALAPEKWNKAYIYAIIEEDKGIVECFFVDENSNELFQEEASEILFEYVCDEYDDYRIKNDEIWYTATFILEEGEDLDVEYDFNRRENLSDQEKLILWQYEYLDIIPDEEFSYLFDLIDEEETNDFGGSDSYYYDEDEEEDDNDEEEDYSVDYYDDNLDYDEDEDDFY